jgi:hypothetical protein
MVIGLQSFTVSWIERCYQVSRWLVARYLRTVRTNPFKSFLFTVFGRLPQPQGSSSLRRDSIVQIHQVQGLCCSSFS